MVRSSGLVALGSLDIQFAGENTHVLIAASRKIDYQYVMRGHCGRNPHALSDCVRGLKRGKNAFGAR